MKKIDRLWETKKLVTVNTPDLNEQEAYIEQLEREKGEAVNALIEVAIPLEDSSGGWGYYNELLQGIIEKLTGKTWEDIKGGKR